MKKKIIIVLVMLIIIALYSFFLSWLDKHKHEETKVDCEPKYYASVKVLNEETGLTLETNMTDEELKDELYCDSLETLAICVEAEAGNQDLYGKRLVVDVILNRVDSERFPNDIESVIYQKNQFSTSFDGGMDRVKEPSEETYEAVRMELENRTDPDILFFTAGDYNKYCSPAYKYGDHYFGY